MIREDKKWFKIEVNSVQIGAQDSNSMIQASTST